MTMRNVLIFIKVARVGYDHNKDWVYLKYAKGAQRNLIILFKILF
jgi:hypothetical protein